VKIGGVAVLVLLLPVLAGCAPTTATAPTATVRRASATIPATATVSPSPSPRPSPTPLPPATAQVEVRAVRGNLSNQIARLEQNAPRANSNRFVVPSDAEMVAFSGIAQEVESRDTEHAARLADRNGYELVRYTDRGDGHAESWLLRERKPFRRGWGMYLFRIGSRNHIVVEAPHPLFDAGTPAVAMAAYRALHARALLVAGAQRNANRDGSADAAHNRRTIFQAVHRALTGADKAVIVLQIHGFSATHHAAYPQVVLSSDHGHAATPVNELAAALTGQGIRVGVCGSGLWKDLCGTRNVQAASMQEGTFIHLELDESIRHDPRGLLAVLAQVMAP